MALGVLLFVESPMSFWRSICVFGFCIFIDKFAFRTGYSVAFCESRGIKLK